MAVLLVAELHGSDLATDATAKAVSAAKKLGDVTVLVAGDGIDGAAQAAAKLDGVARVVAVSDAAYAHGLAEPLADLVVSMAGDFSHIVLPSTASAKNVAPRVAALLDVMVISDVMEVVDADTLPARSMPETPSRR